jgi:outer membrane receptor protein involved in Fe transport
MKLGVKKLSSAVRLALSLGAVIAVGASGTAFAQDAGNNQPAQDQQPSQQKASTLQTVVVTGSHIRRVDLETASPVVSIDRAAIQASGKLTLGDLVQDLPAATGGNTNPQVNNSGGAGSSTIGLRGLGSNRTLILVDGHRVVNNDVNSIPAAMIDRIDVLTTGASSVYGSDAVGGVVNFILRKDYQGAQFTTNFGESDHNDGEQHGYTFTFGQTSDKGSIMAGVDYNKTDGVAAGRRDYSKNSVSVYGTNGNGPPGGIPVSSSIGGSSSSPYGHISLSNTTIGDALGNCGFAARNPGTAGATASDYHCYQTHGNGSDLYNYATVNLVMTPQERTGGFLSGSYALTDHVTAYMDSYYNKTTAHFQLAPGVYTTAGGVVISADSYYNPFKYDADQFDNNGVLTHHAGDGVEYSSTGNSFGARLSALGNREGFFGTTTEQVHTGLKGDFPIGDQTWQWDAGLDYGHIGQTTVTTGLPNLGVLNAGSGPSFLDPTSGQVVCGTPTAPIAGCIPFNAFNLDSPEAKAALAKAAVPALSQVTTIEKSWHLDFNGGVFDLPAGTVQLAGGFDYRKDYAHSIVDPVLTIDTTSGTCTLGSQCSSGLQGGFNVKEAYAETFIPILTDLPAFKSLNLTIGDRYSKYNQFGSTNNLKFAVEWKPFDDLLLRGTMAEVFRAPNIGEVYGAPSSDAPKVSSDPCTGYTGNPVNPACVNVPTDGSFTNTNVATGTQATAITSGSAYAGFPIKPEQGKTFDLGAVYSPSWAPGLSTTVDVWHLYLNDIITTVGMQSVLNLCAAGQTQYCPFIQRIASGSQQGQLASNFIEPTGNLGSTSVSGTDFSINYKLPEFSFGKFSVGVNGTYLKYYNQQTAPGTSSNTTYNDAGHFLTFGSAQAAACPGASGNCLFPRWRAQGFVNWQLGDWDASWRMRYIGRFQMGSKSPSQDVFPDGSCYYEGRPDGAGGKYQCSVTGATYKYGATVYSDVSLGYNIESLNTRVEFGVNNLFDKQPPLLFANNTLNANTDPSDFDLMGRYFWGRVTVKF